MATAVAPRTVAAGAGGRTGFFTSLSTAVGAACVCACEAAFFGATTGLWVRAAADLTRATGSGLLLATVFLTLARLAGFLALAVFGAGLLADIQWLLEGVAPLKNARLYRPTSRCTGVPTEASQPAKVHAPASLPKCSAAGVIATDEHQATPKAFGNEATVR
jgi:hypothetical protein